MQLVVQPSAPAKGVPVNGGEDRDTGGIVQLSSCTSIHLSAELRQGRCRQNVDRSDGSASAASCHYREGSSRMVSKLSYAAFLSSAVS